MVHNIFDNIYRWLNSKVFHSKNQTGLLTETTVNREIYSGLITLKNLAIVYRDRPLSAEAILEILRENSNKLRPFYEELLSNYRTDKASDAFKNFGKNIGTKSAKNFAVILSKLDKINPNELLEQLEVFQVMMIEIRETEEMKIVERKSIVGTVLATATIFCLLINFAVVVVFLDTLELLKHIF